MLTKVRLWAAVLVVLVPHVTKLCAENPQADPYVTPQMMELIHAHRSVLERMNVPDNRGKPPQLGDTRMTGC
jgi:hypothetical protein